MNASAQGESQNKVAAAADTGDNSDSSFNIVDFIVSDLHTYLYSFDSKFGIVLFV